MGEYEDRTGCVYFVGGQQKNQSLKEGIPFVLAGKQVYLPLLELGYFGYCVTAPGSEYDCVSRYFSPELSIPEDPVTGSIHCLLAPYWAKRLGKPGINAFQASKRTGTMRCVCEEDRVKIYGDAVLFNTSVINIC